MSSRHRLQDIVFKTSKDSSTVADPDTCLAFLAWLHLRCRFPVVAQFEFLCELCGAFSAYLAVRGFCSCSPNRPLEPLSKPRKAAKIAKKFKLSHYPFPLTLANLHAIRNLSAFSERAVGLEPYLMPGASDRTQLFCMLPGSARVIPWPRLWSADSTHSYPLLRGDAVSISGEQRPQTGWER